MSDPTNMPSATSPCLRIHRHDAGNQFGQAGADATTVRAIHAFRYA